jgi:hypothetical protein
MILHGLFTSVWDDGTEITTTATLDTETGHIDAEQTDENIEELNCLDSEKFVDSEGNEYEVCPDCHEHILKEKDITDTDEEGNELPEIAGVIICSDPYCESNWISGQDTL